MPTEGSKAPAFSLMDDHDHEVNISYFAGKKNVVLYFFPKDDTPGLTLEASGFRDAMDQFKEAGAVVLGVSADTVGQQAKFRDKYNLNMPLLSDPGKKTISAYGVYVAKNMYGKKVMGIERTTFIIGKDGLIKKIFPKVKVDGHVEQVLAALPNLS